MHSHTQTQFTTVEYERRSATQQREMRLTFTCGTILLTDSPVGRFKPKEQRKLNR